MIFTDLILSALNGRRKKNDEEAEEHRRFVVRTKRAADLKSRGFRYWCAHSPPRDACIQIADVYSDREYVIAAQDVPPEMNVAGLYWRDVNNSPIIEHEACLSPHK